MTLGDVFDAVRALNAFRDPKNKPERSKDFTLD